MHGHLFAMALIAWALFACLLTAIVLAVITRIAPADFLIAHRHGNPVHTSKPRQIGGLAIMPACLLSYLGVVAIAGEIYASPLAAITSMVLLFIVGFLDDLYGLSVASRLAVQFFAAFLFLPMVMANTVALSAMESWMLAAILVVGIAYWINAVNFMDGLDLVTVAGLGIPLAFSGFVLAVCSDAVPHSAIIAILATACLAGFAVFNRPPSTAILGDAGSYFLGAESAFAIIAMATSFSVVAAVLPFLYYAADTATTLLMRLLSGRNIFKAHTQHAYQAAYRKFGRELPVIASIAALNTLLLILAWASLSASANLQLVLLFAGCVASGVLIYLFRK